MAKIKRFSVDSDLRYALVYLGLDETDVLREAGLSLDLFNQKHILLEEIQFSRLWNAIAELDVSDTPLPLRILDFPLFGKIGAPVMAALCSPNFQICVKRIRDFKPLIGPIRLILKESEETFDVQIKASQNDVRLNSTIFISELIFFVALIRHATGLPINPLKVEADVVQDHPGYQQFLGSKIQSSNTTRLTFSKSDSLQPFKLRNDKAWEFFEPEFNKQLNELEMDTGFTALVRNMLMELLPMGVSSIESVAEKLCISTRTLQRKLKSEKTQFQEQLNHCREMLAKHYLLSSNMAITEISFLIGYKDASSFSRSFSIWTGMSPEKYRETSDRRNFCD